MSSVQSLRNPNAFASYSHNFQRKSDNISRLIIGVLALCVVALLFKVENQLVIATQQSNRQELVLDFVYNNPDFIKPKVEKIMADKSEFKLAEVVPPPPKITPPPPKVVPKPPKVIPPPIKPVEPKVEPVKPVKKVKPVKAKPKVIEKPKAVQTAVIGKSADNNAEEAKLVQVAAEEDRKGQQHALGVLLYALEKEKRYPRAARRSGAEGVIPLFIKINSSGIVTEASVKEGNSPRVLERETIKLGKKVIGMKIPNHNGKAMNISVPISYKLN